MIKAGVAPADKYITDKLVLLIIVESHWTLDLADWFDCVLLSFPMDNFLSSLASKANSLPLKDIKLDMVQAKLLELKSSMDIPWLNQLWLELCVSNISHRFNYTPQQLKTMWILVLNLIKCSSNVEENIFLELMERDKWNQSLGSWFCPLCTRRCPREKPFTSNWSLKFDNVRA